MKVTRLKPWILSLAVVFFLVVGPFSVSADSPGSATATFLKLDPYARSAAQGSALLGRSGVSAVHSNVASLGFLNSTETSLTQNNIFAGITYRNASLVHSVADREDGFGLSLTSLNFGDQDRTRIRRSDPITDLGQFSANDLSLNASYGWRIHRTLSVGAGLKYVESNIAGFQDGTFSGDLGIQYRIPSLDWRFGLTGRNLFGSLELNERGDPLPRVYEVGGNYRWSLVPNYHEFDFGFGTGMSTDSDGYFFGGVEYGLYGMGALRVGYHGAQDAGDGITFGAGLQYAGIQVDYAYVPFGDLGRQQRFSFGYRFGGLPQSARSKDESPEPKRAQKEEQKPEPKVQNVEGRLERARRLYRDGSLEESYRILKDLHRKTPKNVDVLLWLGLLEHEMGDRESAINRMGQVLDLDPDNDFARKNLQKLREE